MAGGGARGWSLSLLMAGGGARGWSSSLLLGGCMRDYIRRRGSQLAMRLEETGALWAVDLESWVEP